MPKVKNWFVRRRRLKHSPQNRPRAPVLKGLFDWLNTSF